MDEQVKILRGGGVVRGDYTVVASVDGREVRRTIAYADRGVVRVDCHDGRIVTLSWDDLHAAADNGSDPIARIYERIRELARDRVAYYEADAAHAALLSRALRGEVWIYVSAEHDSTNVWWVSVVRAGNDGIGKAAPLFLRDLRVRGEALYQACDGGTHPSYRLALSEAGDLAQRIRAAFPRTRVHVEGVDP